MTYEFFFAVALSLHGHLLEVDLADTPKTRAQGLMGRRELAEGTGMFFRFEEPERLSFWMKKTPVPLSIAFFDADLKLINKEDMEPMSLEPHLSARPALYALEVPQGWFETHGVEVGDTLKLLDE